MVLLIAPRNDLGTQPHAEIVATPSDFNIGDAVRCRDPGFRGMLGTVTSLDPLNVRPDGWTKSYTWDFREKAIYIHIYT